MPSLPKENDGILVVPLKLEARIRLWNLLREKHMSTSEFARVMGISRQQAQFLVDGSRPVSFDMYYQAFKALGYYLSLELNLFIPCQVLTQLSARFTSVLLVKINNYERFPFVLFSGEILALSGLPDTRS